jgi:membrane protein implicated in regulation of membrane protease activity
VRALATIAFFGGLLLAVRVMFFGVQKRIDEEHLAHRRWPLALAAFLVVTGALLYARVTATPGVTPGWLATVVLLGVVAGGGAWWLVTRSATIPSSDPDDDPRYRFQGHVARVIEPLARDGGDSPGRIGFDFDGKHIELHARWLPDGAWDLERSGLAGSEVVIERVEGDVAYVEPWAVVEERL